MDGARYGRSIRVGLIVAAIVALYPAGSLLLARVGLIATPEQQGQALEGAARSDGTRAGVLLEEARRGVIPARHILLELGYAVAADASGRLAMSRSTGWRVDVRENTRLPAGSRLIVAEEMRPECVGRSRCATDMRLYIIAEFTAAGAVNVSVSHARGALQPQKGWSQEFIRSQERWVRTE